jgi:hypothetical protein
MTAVSGRALYPAMDALISNNYPPVSFFVIGFLGRANANPIFAGRVVALASLLLVTLNVIVWLRTNGVRPSIALGTGATFIITMDALAPGYIAQNDPQWFGHALMTTGMVVLWRNPQSAARLATAGTLLLVGGCIKHLLLPLPVSLGVWLWSKDRRAFWKCLALMGALGLLLLTVTFAAYGNNVIEGVLGAPRRLTVKRPFLVAETVLGSLLPFLWFAATLLRKYRSCSAAQFALNYLGIATIVAALVSAGDGVWVNAAFDIAIAGGLSTGLALEDITARLSSSRSRHAILLCGSVVAGLIFVISAATSLRINIQRLHALPAKIEANAADIEFLRQHDARSAACESLALCFWAGAPFSLDFFNFGQKLKTGRVPMAVCSQLFDGRRFTVLHLYSPTNSDALLPRACSSSIAEHYQLARSSINGIFLIPTPRLKLLRPESRSCPIDGINSLVLKLDTAKATDAGISRADIQCHALRRRPSLVGWSRFTGARCVYADRSLDRIEDGNQLAAGRKRDCCSAGADDSSYVRATCCIALCRLLRAALTAAELNSAASAPS